MAPSDISQLRMRRAFTINNAFFSFKLPDGMSVYTAELATILEALKFVNNHRILRSCPMQRFSVGRI